MKKKKIGQMARDVFQSSSQDLEKKPKGEGPPSFSQAVSICEKRTIPE